MFPTYFLNFPKEQILGVSQIDVRTLEDDQCELPTYEVPDDFFVSLPDWSEALFAVLNIIVLIFSLCGNIGALLVLYKSEVSKSSTKMYLASLAVCDLILTLTSPTVDLTQLLARYGSWVLGSFLCNALPFLQTGAVMGVALFLTIIAADRYLYIVKAFDQPSSFERWRDTLLIISVLVAWIFAWGLATPNLWYYDHSSFWTYIIVNGEKVRPRNETCKMYYLCLRTNFDSYNIAYYSVLGIAFLLPTICFLFCYGSILIFVRRHVAVMSQVGGVGIETRIARNRKTLRLILALIFLNLVCRLPVWCFVVVTNLKETETTTLTLFLFFAFHLLSNLNSLFNPFVYAIFNDSIRSTRNSGGMSSGQSSGFWNFFTSCCYNHIKLNSVDYFLERKNKNNYDFTKNSKFIPSVSTQKFNVSDRNEFAKTSANTSF